MNKHEWRQFYTVLRRESSLGSSIATYGMDFAVAWRAAIPRPARRTHLWATGLEASLWYFALTLYGTPSAKKLRDYYQPLTSAWQRYLYGLPYRKEKT